MIKVDRHTVIQVLGDLMNKPNLLSDTDKYCLEPSDFANQLDKYVFSAIYNLYINGAEKIHTVDVDNYLQSNPIAKDLIENENGLVFIQDCESNSETENFDYYYKKLKKYNLLRDIQKTGRNISDIYCEDIFNPSQREINERFELMSITDVLNIVKNDYNNLERKYVLNNYVEESCAYDGIEELIDELKNSPEIGCKLQGDYFNTITRGGRKGKLYLRSAGSGVGKTRNMVGDACDIAYPIRYDPRYKRWVSTGSCEKVLYVMTEQDVDEIKTMILSHLTGYNEDMFLYGTYGEKEMPRIKKAIDIMEKYKGNMLFARIPDPCSAVVKNLFRRYNIQHGVENFFYDYIFSSPAMLNEYRDLKIREDVALRLFTTSLKNLAIELNVFVLSSTQLSNDDENKKGGFRDFRNIQGSRAIVNLVDFACIMSRPAPEELELVSGFRKAFSYEPNIVIDIFKNRRGRWNMVRIWSYVDLGTCRREDLFITNSMNKPVEDFQLYNFTSNDPMYKELEEFYNNGEVSESIEQQFYVDENEVKDIFENIEETFGSEHDLKQRFKETDLEDML